MTAATAVLISFVRSGFALAHAPRGLLRAQPVQLFAGGADFACANAADELPRDQAGPDEYRNSECNKEQGCGAGAWTSAPDAPRQITPIGGDTQHGESVSREHKPCGGALGGRAGGLEGGVAGPLDGIAEERALLGCTIAALGSVDGASGEPVVLGPPAGAVPAFRATRPVFSPHADEVAKGRRREGKQRKANGIEKREMRSLGQGRPGRKAERSSGMVAAAMPRKTA